MNNNSNFSSLIYKMIGEPERWHDDFMDEINYFLAEAGKLDIEENLAELETGEKLVSRLRQHSDTLSVFSTLLDKSRFKMIMLNEAFKPIYHNHIAQDLFSELSCSEHQGSLAEEVLSTLELYPNIDEVDVLHALELRDSNGDQIYLRTIHGESPVSGQMVAFHLLLVLDRGRSRNRFNQDLVAKFELSSKEQDVLGHLMRGSGIKEIANDLFVSENTIKSHLKSIYRKTKTNSQADVIRLMLTHESRVLESYFSSNSSFTEEEGLSAHLDQSVLLHDGSKIVYREYGPSHGNPIVMFHSGYGCRLSVPHNHQEVLERHNRRLIIMDRPGFGKSPAIADHPSGWNQRMHEFIDKLELTQYDLLGAVLGSKMTLNFASEADQRLGKVILAGPILINTQDDNKYLRGIMLPAAHLVRASKKVSIEIYELWLKSVTLNLAKYYRKMLDSSVGSAEREQFEVNGTMDILINSFQEGSRINLSGISHEQHYSLEPLETQLSDFSHKTVLWHGTEDGRFSTDGVKAIAKQLPNCTLHICEGYSEHIYYSKFEDIIA